MRRSVTLSLGALAIAAAALAAAIDGAAAADDAGPAHAEIRLDATERQAIGLTYAVAERRALDDVIRASARVAYDERAQVVVALKVSGFVEKLFVDFTGRAVRKGEPLFSLYSPELVGAEQDLLLAVRGERDLARSPVPGAAESAAALVRASRERLRLWGLGDGQIRALEQSGRPSLRRTIAAPASGVVVEKLIVAGQSVAAGAPLYRIADLSRVWVYADVHEPDLAVVRIGQAADIRFAALPGRSFAARVAYVDPALDPASRTAKLRFELDNRSEPMLRPDMYGTAELRVPLGERLVVPSGAVLDSGRRQIVFVDGGGGRLLPSDVTVGARVGDAIEITRGVAAGDRVVARAAFLVDSESQLRGAESMMGAMGAIGMGDWKMESARPMTMGGGEAPPEAAPSAAAPAVEEKRVGELLVAVLPGNGVAAVGAAPIRVRLRDASGAPVEHARVRLEYTMDMPGMTIERAEARELGAGLYEASARFAMAGPWGVVVAIEIAGRPELRARFTLRVAG